jgi:hypothetical protein
MAFYASSNLPPDHRKFLAELEAAVRDVAKRWNTGLSLIHEDAEAAPCQRTLCKVRYEIPLLPEREPKA